MLAGIAAYLPPLPQAYLRSAGCIGGEVFSEVVSRGVLEVYALDDTATTKRASEDALDDATTTPQPSGVLPWP